LDEVDVEEQNKFEESFKNKFIKMNQQSCRPSVSAEAYGEFNKKGKFSVKVIKKTEEQKKLIEEKVLKSFLFNSLEEKELRNVIDAMGEKKIK
jgi:cAMP-dependent protein kinase regulator